MINAMQIQPSWIGCKIDFSWFDLYVLTNDDLSVFNNPQGTLKGIIAAAYPLGAIVSLPFIPVINDKFGRRWSIFVGSAIMVAASLIQGFATNGEYQHPYEAFLNIQILRKRTQSACILLLAYF